MFTEYANKAGGRGNTIVIVASGPSVTQEQVDYVRGKAPVLVINDNYKLAPWGDWLYACDQKWWLWHEDDKDLLDFKGRKFTQSESWEGENLSRIKAKHNLTVIKSVGKYGLSTDPDFIHQGGNSGYQAINLAYHLGASKVILIGYDMQATGDKGHWFGEHPDKIRSNYKNFCNRFEELAKHAKEMNLGVINCTPTTALTCFPKMSLKHAL